MGAYGPLWKIHVRYSSAIEKKSKARVDGYSGEY